MLSRHDDHSFSGSYEISRQYENGQYASKLGLTAPLLLLAGEDTQGGDVEGGGGDYLFYTKPALSGISPQQRLLLLSVDQW